MNIIQEIRVLVKLNRIWEGEKKLLRLRLTSSTALQILGGVLQALNVVDPYLSTKGKIYCGMAIGIIQVIVNTISHLSNPDGTDAKVAYEQPGK